MTRVTVALNIAKTLMANGHRPQAWEADQSAFDFFIPVTAAEKFIPPVKLEPELKLSPDDDWHPQIDVT